MTDIVLLDGGMGQELMKRSGDKPTPLWSTRVMLDHPGIVQAVHTDFFSAGATVATTNTYSIHRDRLVGTGLEDSFADLLCLAMAEAGAARDAVGRGQIAGSIGPLVASYQPQAHPPFEAAVPLYTEIAQILAPKVDFIICETVASLAHAQAVLDGALTSGLPVWLAVTVDDEDGSCLRSGEPVAGVIAIAKNGASALMVNCSVPEVVTKALDSIAHCDLPFGAYANGFQRISEKFLKKKPTVDALSARSDLGPKAYAEFALGWVEQGATIVGGCCEVGPAHIKELARALSAAGHTIV